MKPVTPLLTVDALITYKGQLVLIKRKNPPYKDQFALPGGFVDIGETVEEAAIREAKEETDLDIKITKLLGVYSDPKRDPRGHTVSVCFVAKGKGNLKAGSDAGDIGLFDIDKLPELAFDHNKIVADMVKSVMFQMCECGNDKFRASVEYGIGQLLVLTCTECGRNINMTNNMEGKEHVKCEC